MSTATRRLLQRQGQSQNALHRYEIFPLQKKIKAANNTASFTHPSQGQAYHSSKSESYYCAWLLNSIYMQLPQTVAPSPPSKNNQLWGKTQLREKPVPQCISLNVDKWWRNKSGKVWGTDLARCLYPGIDWELNWAPGTPSFHEVRRGTNLYTTKAARQTMGCIQFFVFKMINVTSTFPYPISYPQQTLADHKV